MPKHRCKQASHELSTKQRRRQTFNRTFAGMIVLEQRVHHFTVPSVGDFRFHCVAELAAEHALSPFPSFRYTVFLDL